MFGIFQHPLLFVLLVVSLSGPCAGVRKVERRCRESTSRTRCTFYHDSDTLRCDNTNYTSIPAPKDLAKIETFASPKYSQFLYINKSCIHEIEPEKLEMYNYLIELDLCENFIQTIQSNAFGNSRSLQKLFIAGNQIIHIDSLAFNGLPVLTHLHLGSNKLQQIPPEALLTVAGSLRVLKLNNNLLDSLSGQTFASLKKLEELDLSGNNLQRFPPKCLKGLGNLRVLHLQENRLEAFEKEVFLAADDIEEINLSNNSITCLDEDAFDGQFLKKVKLHGNPLETPKSDWFHDAHEEGRVEISSVGAWVCDCRAYNYLVFLDGFQNNQEELTIHDIQCNAPADLQGEMLSSLDWNSLKKYSGCSNPDEPSKCMKPTSDIPRAPPQPVITTSTSSTEGLIVEDSNENGADFYEAEESENHQPFQENEQSQEHLDSEAWNNKYTIYALAAVGGLFFIIVVVLSVCKYNRTEEKSKESQIKTKINIDQKKEDPSMKSKTTSNSRTESYSIQRREPASEHSKLYNTCNSNYDIMEQSNRCSQRKSNGFSEVAPQQHLGPPISPPLSEACSRPEPMSAYGAPPPLPHQWHSSQILHNATTTPQCPGCQTCLSNFPSAVHEQETTNQQQGQLHRQSQPGPMNVSQPHYHQTISPQYGSYSHIPQRGQYPQNLTQPYYPPYTERCTPQGEAVHVDMHMLPDQTVPSRNTRLHEQTAIFKDV